jgi:hypothetical protein
MQTINPQEELRKVRIALSINLVACVFMLIEFIISINSGVTWRIVCSGIPCGVFFFLTFAIFTRSLKLQKQLNS